MTRERRDNTKSMAVVGRVTLSLCVITCWSATQAFASIFICGGLGQLASETRAVWSVIPLGLLIAAGTSIVAGIFLDHIWRGLPQETKP